jgi:uncharacterized protein (DUF58 family)
MMRPLVVLGILIYALILAGLATLGGVLLVLALPLIVYLAAGLADQPAAPSLSITRSLGGDRVAPGAPVAVKLTVVNQGAHLQELLLEDHVPPLLRVVDGAPKLLAALAPGATAELSYTIAGPRGRHSFLSVRATASDRLGLIRRSVTIAAPAQLFVVPELIKLHQIAIRPRRTQVFAGSIPARQGGSGVEFFGVRGYQPGDSTRWINGRASARHPEGLFVNEFEQERVTEVGMIVDVRARCDVVTARGALFEHGIQAAAALADSFIERGHRVGLLLYGNMLDWTFPGYGKFQRERMMRALARATPGDSAAFEDLDRIPTRLFPARAQLVLVSPLLPRDRDMLIRLRARRYELLVISPNPIAYEQRALGTGPSVLQGAKVAGLERVVLLRALRRAGITVVDWDVEQPFQQVVAAALGRAPRWPGGAVGLL